MKPPGPAAPARVDHLRFYRTNEPLAPTFGNDRFARRAEAFTRFFGTPVFLGAQTVVVAVWIGLNVAGLSRFDVYLFILLNLAFSLQAAYAAPLILLAQTRRAARDQADSQADAPYREVVAVANEQRQALVAEHAQPVAPLEPLLTLYAATTPATLDGRHPDGWYPEQKLSIEEAIEAYTLGSAYAEFQDGDKGSIVPGKLADLVLLSADVLHIPPAAIRDVRVLRTWVGGREVYDAVTARP